MKLATYFVPLLIAAFTAFMFLSLVSHGSVKGNVQNYVKWHLNAK